MTTTKTTPQTKTKKKVPPDARAVAALALLLEGVDEARFDEGFNALIESLKPRIRETWYERRLKREVFDPLDHAVQSGDTKTILQALYTNDTAMAMLSKMQGEHKRNGSSAA
jgi:hypothetical protein